MALDFAEGNGRSPRKTDPKGVWLDNFLEDVYTWFGTRAQQWATKGKN